MPSQMSNNEVAAIFTTLADLLEISGESRFKVNAYRTAAESIRQLPNRIQDVRARGELDKIPGVGKAVHEKIESLLDTGSFKLFDEIRSRYPATLTQVLEVPDVGPKRARAMYDQLGIDSLASLREAIETGKIRELKGLGERGAERLSESVQSMTADEESERRIPIGQALEIGQKLIRDLRTANRDVNHIELAGSVRRFRDTIGDLDVVAAAPDAEPVVKSFIELPQVRKVDMKGGNRARVLLEDNIFADLWVVPPESWGSLLFHITGNKYHDIKVRDMAIEKGYHLSEYGFESRDGEKTPCATEEDVYKFVGIPFIPAPMRENTGEIDRALKHTLPKPVEVKDLRGDLHTHSHWSDGTRSIREMATAAIEHGYEYICITDHSQSLGVANGLNPERLAEQRKEIEKLNHELSPFRILQGVELEVRTDSKLDLPDDVLARLDIVVASVHSGLRQSAERVTERALTAINHPLVDVLAHPTGRIIGRRQGGNFDMERLFTEAADTGTVLEINGDLARLDLRDQHAHAAIAAGCLLSVDSDAHSIEGLDNVRYGVLVATRAWVEPKQVINTRKLDDLLGRLKRNQR